MGQPLEFILGVVYSQLVKKAHLFCDENLTNAVKSGLQKIGEGISQLKIKDLKLSEDQLKSILIRLENKFSGDSSPSLNLKLRDEIDRELKEAQKSAMAGSNSGLASTEQVKKSKHFLMIVQSISQSYI